MAGGIWPPGRQVRADGCGGRGRTAAQRGRSGRGVEGSVAGDIALRAAVAEGKGQEILRGNAGKHQSDGGGGHMPDKLAVDFCDEGKVNAPDAHRARTMNCSVWLPCGVAAKAATVTFSTAWASPGALRGGCTGAFVQPHPFFTPRLDPVHCASAGRAGGSGPGPGRRPGRPPMAGGRRPCARPAARRRGPTRPGPGRRNR